MLRVVANPFFNYLRDRRIQKKLKKYEKMRAEAKGTEREELVEKEIREEMYRDSLLRNSIIF